VPERTRVISVPHSIVSVAPLGLLVMHQAGMNSRLVVRVVVVLTFVWTVAAPFYWASNLNQRFAISSDLAIVAYRPEFVALLPIAVVLVGAWLIRPWAFYGLLAVAILLPLLKFTLGGVSSLGMSVISSCIFVLLAFRLKMLAKENA